MYRLFLPLLLAFAAVPAVAQDMQDEAQALAQDAAEYARNHRVAEDEALRRLRAMTESVAATDAIRDAFAARLAGIAIEHAPEFLIRVRLTGAEPVPARTIRAGGMSVPILFETGAAASRAQILAAIDRHREGIRAIIDHDGMGFDGRVGALVVLTDLSDLGGASAEIVADRIAALTGVPVQMRVLNRPAETENAALAGVGGRLEGTNPGDTRRFLCTTGFAVTDGTRTGIVTAAHCPDALSYKDSTGADVPLAYVGGWGAGFQDVQVHVGPEPQPASFRASDGARPQLGRRFRSETRAGETVCHRGEASGYSCAEVELTDFAPPGDLCGGPCHATWVTVAGPTCRGGDSGGPVFVGGIAFGIVKGGNYAADGRCNFYFYMSTDYLPPGWSLLLDEPALSG